MEDIDRTLVIDADGHVNEGDADIACACTTQRQPRSSTPPSGRKDLAQCRRAGPRRLGTFYRQGKKTPPGGDRSPPEIEGHGPGRNRCGSDFWYADCPHR